MVEVLPESEFKEQHISCAISLPLTELSRSAPLDHMDKHQVETVLVTASCVDVVDRSMIEGG